MAEELNDFKWDEFEEGNEQPENFIEQIESEDLLDDEGNELSGEEKEKKVEQIHSQKEEEIKSSLFENEEEESEEEEEDDEEEGEISGKPKGEKKSEEPVVASTSSYVAKLKEKGLITFELEEGAELTDELAEEILEDSLDDKVESRIEELHKDLPDVVKQLNKFAMQGGNLSEFFSKLIPTSTTKGYSVDSDINEESVQEAVVRDSLATEGFDAEYIDSQIQFLKDSKKLGSVSQNYFNKFVEKDKADKASLVQRQQDAVKADKENQRKYKSEITSKVNSLEDIKGMKITDEEKGSLPSYMSDKNVKLKNGSSISEMQRDLYQALQDPEKSILLAKLVKSDFDFSTFSKDANTSIARKVKEELQNNNTPQKSAGRSSKKKKGLADMFD